MNISVIYPLHVTFNNLYIFERIQWCLNNTHKNLPDAEHVVVLSGNWLLKNKVIKLLKPYKDLVVLSDYKPATPYSPGTARNYGVTRCTRENLLFWDIDLLGSEKLFSNISKQTQEIASHNNKFEMYPCLYLCKEYSKDFKGNLEQAWIDATQLKTNSIEHFAMATSTILCNKQHFIELGAFDESFIGHMGEDLELLNRLTIAYGKFDFETDHCENHPSKVASELKGFRKNFLNYSAPHLKNKEFTVHLYHDTQIGSRYKKRNKENLSLLTKIIEKTPFISTGDAIIRKKNIITTINPVPAHTLPEYLKVSPSIKRSSLNNIKRKTRKLLLNPIRFFKDMN